MGRIKLDSPIIVFLNHVADIMFVNVAFLLTCIPVVTYGAARASLYACSVKWMKKDEAGIREYIKEFRRNFRPCLLPGLVVLLITAVLFLDLLFAASEGGTPVMRVFAVFGSIVFLPYREQVFLTLARFECRFRELWKNALLILLIQPLRAILAAAMMALPLVLFVTVPQTFFRFLWAWGLLYYAAAARINVPVTDKAFRIVIESREEKAAADGTERKEEESGE